MTKQTTRIPIASIILDEDIYPRKSIDPRPFGIFAENIRDGFKFDPMEVKPDPDHPGMYRLLDGAHRWSSYKTTGVTEAEVVIKNLNGEDPLLYAAKKAIGPRQLTEDEARDTARRAYTKNPSLTSADIGKAIGRARRTADSYIADLGAATQLDIDLKIFRMNRLGIPQDRIADRLGQIRETIRNQLAKMATLPNQPNADLSRGFTVAQVAEKHGWAEPMVWSLALQDKEALDRFREVGWGLRTWAQWEWNDCLPREIYVNNSEAYFTAGDKRFGDDWSARHRSRPTEAVSAAQGFRSGEAGGRDFQNKPASKESYEGAILIDDYLRILNKTGWQHTHIIQAPMSAQRFSAIVVSAMQKKRILGVTRRYVIILK
ncbi:MAG: ParB N-terminal domain-containing protein [Deltaproteobacteria bacterium]|nr:ParB N-terminal domain-containing protein [Deltaproteobacteria bacterium]